MLCLCCASLVMPIAFMVRKCQGSLRSVLGSSVRNPGYPWTMGGIMYLRLLWITGTEVTVWVQTISSCSCGSADVALLMWICDVNVLITPC